MVHALQVVHRLLRPDGLLLDLRPAPIHRHVGIKEGDLYHDIGRLDEVLVDDRAADRAIREVISQGYYRRIHRDKFIVNRYLDSLDSFKDWYEEFSHDKPCKFNPRLVERVKTVQYSLTSQASLVITGPVIINLLKKI